MRVVPLVWRRMASACFSSPAFWTAALGIPLLSALHSGGSPFMAAAGALAFSMPSAVTLCWASGRARRAFIATLETTCSGLASLSVAEISLPVLIGVVPALAGIAAVSSSQGLGVPWQVWPVAFMSSVIAASTAYLAVRRSLFLAVAVLAVPLLLGFLQAPPGIVELAAWPDHALNSALWEQPQGGSLHPDAFVAVDLALGSALAALSLTRMHGRRAHR